MSIVLILLMVAWYDGAEEGTRTPTPLRVRGPEPRASANSATSAQKTYLDALARQAATLSLANAATRVKFAAGRGIGGGKSAPPEISFKAPIRLGLLQKSGWFVEGRL